MKKFKVKICNEHFKRFGSGNRPRHSLIVTANDIKDAWKKHSLSQKNLIRQEELLKTIVSAVMTSKCGPIGKSTTQPKRKSYKFRT